MKIDRHDQAKILSSPEISRLFTTGLKTKRDATQRLKPYRTLFGICLFTGCRVSEALALQTTDIKSGTITLRKSTTKGKLKTRVVDIQVGLAELLAEYQPKPGALFPGLRGVTERLTRFAVDKILRDTEERVGLVGVSTHSFRRTARTMMPSAGVP
ncbi:MAG: tyrosine-type recombinase/integrase [Rhizonema sp. NSF051]|nr:tyrosine-type recombinase/integrase [Rhizonema sp. NSF051]